MYKALDLFSGIGGNAYALRGLFKTVLYCDISANARKSIKRNIERGILDEAPVLSDVRQLDASILNSIRAINKDNIEHIDAIIGSFPCQGLSPLGPRTGFSHAETGLFHEIVRIASVFNPKILFMENVPNVLNKEIRVIARCLGDLGYELRWVVMGAHGLGAPQVRNRWFCLCVRNEGNDDGPLAEWKGLAPVEQFKWEYPPRRTVPPLEDMYRSARCALLGNSVVPDVVRQAFFFLASGMRDWSPAFDGGDASIRNMDAELLESDFCVEEDLERFPRCGVWREGRVYECEAPTFPRPNINLRLLSEMPTSVSKKVRSPIITETTLKTFSTPRKGSVIACKTLTERSARDLPTQLKFAEDTPQEDRQYQMSANWVEWLMGYPQDYTRFAA